MKEIEFVDFPPVAGTTITYIYRYATEEDLKNEEHS